MTNSLNEDKYLVWTTTNFLLVLSLFVLFSCSEGEPFIEQEPTIDPGQEVFNPDGRVFYLDQQLGKDGFNGLSPSKPWRSLEKASTTYKPGDWIVLRAGQTFKGQLLLTNLEGTAELPIKIGVFGATSPEDRAKINCSGQTSGLELYACSFIEVENIEIFGDGGGTSPDRRGVHCTQWGYLDTNAHLYFNNLYIHDLFAPRPKSSDGKRESHYEGTAIQFSSPNVESAHFRDIRIENCTVENVGTHAVIIHKWPNENQVDLATFHEDIVIVDNDFSKLGGDGIVTAGCKNLYVARNTITEPGCFDDQRMKGRGDCLWTWYTLGALVEYNTFSGARGRLDCTGMHVDIGSQNNIFQYNLSRDNEGGFCEIIGDSYNNVYRYNVSINDGERQYGLNEFGRQKGPGVVILLSGYMANRLGQGVKKGPYNSYFYNNTIYTNASITANFSVDHTAKGALIANNLFIIEGRAEDISWKGPTDIGSHENIIFRNNRTVIGYPAVPNDALNELNAWDFYLENKAIDPQCANSGGKEALDYLPGNPSEIQNKGIELYILPNDPIGVPGGFIPSTGDFRGIPISGHPDIGAFELK